MKSVNESGTCGIKTDRGYDQGQRGHRWVCCLPEGGGIQISNADTMTWCGVGPEDYMVSQLFCNLVAKEPH